MKNEVEKCKLDDPTIRAALIARLSKLSVAPKRIIEELTVHEGKAIADVVAVHSTVHCYEIKGDGDKVTRVLHQSKYYDSVFKKVTLVTTAKHQNLALAIAPSHWGLLLAQQSNEEVVFRYLRRARPSPLFSQTTALLTLWRSELMDIAKAHSVDSPDKLNKPGLADRIGMSLSKAAAEVEIGRKLQKRIYQNLKSRTI